MLAYVSQPSPFSALLMPRSQPRKGLPLTFFDTGGGVDPLQGYRLATRGQEMERVREETTRLTETGYLLDDPRTSRLVWWLRRMGYDDALVWDKWRVELLYLETGQPHFRLYWKGHVFGVVGIATSHADLGQSRNLEVGRCMLAAYLVGWGWEVQDTRLIRDGAMTPYTANVDHQYRLFDIKTGRKSEAGYDLLRDEGIEE
jgi:hypothetical protein